MTLGTREGGLYVMPRLQRTSGVPSGPPGLGFGTKVWVLVHGT